MESFEDLIRRVVNSFNAGGLDYMLIGALAASYYGTPRTTMDIDVVIRVDRGKPQVKLVSTLREAGFEYVCEYRDGGSPVKGTTIFPMPERKNWIMTDLAD